MVWCATHQNPLILFTSMLTTVLESELSTQSPESRVYLRCLSGI